MRMKQLLATIIIGTTAAFASTATLAADITGAGSTFAYPIYAKWAEMYKKTSGNGLNYQSIGSGAGIKQIKAKTVDFGASDMPLPLEELNEAGLMQFPTIMGGVVAIVNLDGVAPGQLKLTGPVVADIYLGKITKWNDQAIAALNDGVDLPDTAISPVHRSDDSGTTDNFTQYLSAAAEGAWKHDPDGVWPIKGGEAAEGTSGMVAAVKGGEGTIGYADESQAGGLGLISIQVGSDFVAPSAEGAAKAVAVSKPVAGRDSVDLALDIDRTTTEPGAYPVLLASYLIACQHYSDENEAALVKGFLSYIVSDEGQQAAAAQAGSAPLDSELASKAADIVGAISAN
jgi:phosphate transport system substrate-binding protein